MSTRQLPSVELIQGTPPVPPVATRRNPRFKVFFGVLVVALAVGLAIVYGRSPVYRAVASVLTVKPKAVDARSAEADTEHVVIQGRLLMGEDLLGRLSRRLAAEGDEIAGMDQLRGLLAVVPVPETNLLELRAEGEDPERLQRLVNRWAESYEEFRAEEIEAATGRTTAELEDQQLQLQTRIDAARAELQAFREANDIVSLERGENSSLAKLKGLNDSLNKAQESLIAARARKTAVDEAIARGETVVPNEQKAEIAKLQLGVQRGRVRLAELRQRYTQVYIDRDPVLKSLPGELRLMEDELAHAMRLARTTVSDEAQQEVEAARVSVAALEQQLAEHQRNVQLFNDRFKEFKALEENLARLDTLHADNQQRLAQIQVSNFRKYPPIQVVEWARVPARPIYPDYERDLLIAIAAALGLALFVTWLVEYLSGQATPPPGTPYLGVRIHPGDQLAGPEAGDRRLIDHPERARDALAAPASNLPVLPRELAAAEVEALMGALEPSTAAYSTLLLSGVSPYELPLLHAGCFDRDRGQISVPGAGRREIVIGTRAWQRLQPILGDLDGTRMSQPVAEIDSRLRAGARDARLADPGNINALALWHSYVVFLIRQGIDAPALAQRVGAVPPEVLNALMHYAPPGGSRPPGSIEFTYPAL